MVWNVIAFIFLMIFFYLSSILIKKLKHLKNAYKEKDEALLYKENILVKETYKAGNLNRVYKNTLDSRYTIDKYILSFEDGQPVLMCNFLKPLSATNIIQVYGFNSDGKLHSITQIEHPSLFKDHPIIVLPKKVVDVNIHFEHVDQKEELIEIHAQKVKDYRKIGLFQSMVLFFLLVPMSYIILSILAGPILEGFMNWITISLGLLIILFTCTLNFLSISIWLSFQSKVEVN